MFKELIIPEIKELLRKKDYKSIKEFITECHPSDIADLLESLTDGEAAILFLLLPKEQAGDTFSELETKKQEAILKQLTDQQIRELVLELEPDERTELFEELPGQITRKILQLLPPEDRRETLKILAYPEESVGRLITPEYIAVKPYWTVKEAMEYIRKNGKDAETIDIVYVVDDSGKLLDDIPIRRFILAHPDDKVESLMDGHYISISAYEDQEKAVQLVKQYNLIALPVTDSKGILLGIVTVDDIIDVMEEESTEDFRKIGGVGLSEEEDLVANVKEMSLKRLYRSRVPWLLVLLFMNIFSGGVISLFEGTIARYVVLVTFLPVIIATAGNAGSQSSTLMVRALAIGNVKLSDWAKLIGRELLISAALGLTAGIGIFFIGIARGGIKVSIVVLMTMIINVIIGSILGMSLPFLFTKLKKDPATASTPLITTMCDIIGTSIYFLIATNILF
ncbi:MAG: magnesium transporter [Candidatus Marinimicrobia bacterium]|nr:magnesium transporter [Candidatus Neomarinimicrobiota bacterium]RLG32699.1 MAG: magnesium transporter [Methanosarcinales archaeon]